MSFTKRLLVVTLGLGLLTACVSATRSDLKPVDGVSKLRLNAVYDRNRQIRQSLADDRSWRETPGPICGDPRLVGVPMDPIVIADSRCGVADPVKISAIAGVALTGRPTMSCGFAGTFADWIEGSLIPLAVDTGKTLNTIETMGGYACRNRYHAKVGRLSNHALGNAIDIGAYRFADGTRLEVLANWPKETARGFLKTSQLSACKAFNTVIGPEYNAPHANHFHFDIDPKYRDGSFCPLR